MRLFLLCADACGMQALATNLRLGSASLLRPFVRGLFGAVADLHARGWLHLDIKFENILVSRQGAVRLIDFGCALPLPVLPNARPMHAGTHWCRAPELVRSAAGLPITKGTDVFAAALLCMEVLFGTFQGDDDDEWVFANHNVQVRSLQFLSTSNLPRGLATLLASCVAADSSARPAAEHVANSLDY